METYVKIFLKDLLANRDNLSQYIDLLYSDEHKHQDLNEMFGLLKKRGLHILSIRR